MYSIVVIASEGDRIAIKTRYGKYLRADPNKASMYASRVPSGVKWLELLFAIHVPISCD